MNAPAVKTAFELLIRRQVGDIHHAVGSIRPVRAITPRAWYRTSHLTAVITPVEAEPRSLFERLVLQMRRLIESLVVIDAKHRDRARR